MDAHRQDGTWFFSALIACHPSIPCGHCGKVSRKSILELETKDSLPCDFCGFPIKVTDHYGQAEIAALLERLGRPGYILRDRQKGE